MNLFKTKNNLARLLTLPILVFLPLAANAHGGEGYIIFTAYLVICVIALGALLAARVVICSIGKYARYYFRKKGKKTPK